MTTRWTTDPMLALDTETTSPEPTQAHLVTATGLTVSHGAITNHREWLADPGIDIPDDAATIHGITTEHARTHGRRETDVIAEILGWLAEHWNLHTPLVIYNAPYDLTLIDHRARALGIGHLRIRGPILDPLVIDRGLDRYRKAGPRGRTLTKVAEHYNITLTDADAHTSVGDSLAAYRVALALADRFPRLPRLSYRELYQAQRRWYREWALNYQAYRRRCLTEENAPPEDIAAVTISTHWPITPHPDQEAAA